MCILAPMLAQQVNTFFSKNLAEFSTIVHPILFTFFFHNVKLLGIFMRLQ